jgi:hypothetical protein
MRVSCVGAWAIFNSPTSRWASSRFDWPFGRIELDGEQLVLSVRGPLGPLFAFASRIARDKIPVVIAVGTIRHVAITRSGRRFPFAKIRCSDPNIDGVAFGAFRSRFDALIAQFRAVGVPIVGD